MNDKYTRAQAIRDEMDKLVMDSMFGAAATTTNQPTTGLTSVRKMAMRVPISNELAMEYGLIPDTRPPVVITRRTRFRWWRQGKVRAFRLRAGEFVAGQRFHDGEDD